MDAFSRTVKIEEEDAEAWSNLAVALLRLPVTEQNQSSANDSEVGVDELVDSQKNVKSAFVAFKRGAKLKRDSYRIWQNLLMLLRLSRRHHTMISSSHNSGSSS